MINPAAFHIDASSTGQADTGPKEDTRAHELAMLDLARNVAESLAPHLCFAENSFDPGTSRAQHPTIDGKSYTIRQSTGGRHTASVVDETSHSPAIELYSGYTASSAVAWCRLHALFGHEHSPNFLVSGGHFYASGGYILQKDENEDDRWLLATVTGERLGPWTNPIQAELFARIHKNLGGDAFSF